MKKYVVVIEETGMGYSAYSPDLPRCVATGATRAEVERNIGRTLSLPRNELRADGELVPEPHTSSAYRELPAC